MNPIQNVMKILWLALLVSQGLFLYLLLGMPDMQGLESTTAEQDPFSFDPTLFPFYVMATGALVASVMIPKIIFKAQLKKEIPNSLYVPFILRLALNESIALVGFVVGIQTQTISAAIPFFVVSILRHLSFFPAPSKIERWKKTKNF